MQKYTNDNKKTNIYDVLLRDSMFECREMNVNAVCVGGDEDNTERQDSVRKKNLF